MASRSLGTLTLDLIAKIGGFTDPMDKAARNAKKNTDSIHKDVKALSVAVGVAAAGIATGFAVMMKGSIDAADEIYKQSQVIGMSVEQLSALKFTAGEAGVGFDGLTASLGKFNKNIDEATSGKGAAFDAFSDLGIKLKDANGELKSSSVLFEEVAEAMSTLEDGATKTALAQDLLGKSGKELIPLLNAGAKGLREGAEEAARLGQVIGTDAAADAERFNDNISRLQKSVTGMANTVAMEAIPGLADLTDKFADPEFQNGVANIARGLLDIASASVTALTEMSKFATWVGEEIAARTNGINVNDIPRLEQLLDDLKAQQGKGFFTRALNYRDDQKLADAISDTQKILANAYKKAGEAAQKSNQQMADTGGAVSGIEKLADSTGKLTAAQIEARRLARAAAEAQQKELAKSSEEYEKLRASLQKEIDLWGNKSKAVELAYDLERGLIVGLDAARKQQLVDMQKQIDLIAEIGESTNKFFDSLPKNVEDSVMGNFEKVAKSVSATFGEAAGFTEDAFERINGAASDMWVNFTKDAESALDGVKDVFLRTIAEMAHEGLTKPIILSFQQSFSGGSGGDGKGAGAGLAGAIGVGGIYAAAAVAVVAAVSSWNKDQDKKFEKMTAEYRQGTQSLGTVLGFANQKSDSINQAIERLAGLSGDSLGVNRDMLRALIDIRQGISGSAAGFVRQGLDGTGAAAGVNTGKWAVGIMASLDRGPLADTPGVLGDIFDSLLKKAAKDFYNKKVKVTDSGIQILGETLADMLERGVVGAVNYAEIRTTKKILGVTTSVKSRTQTAELDDMFKSQLADIFEGASDVLGKSAAIFGIEFDSYLKKLVISSQKLSLKDLTGDELVKEIESFFSSTLDNWAGVLLGGTDVLKKYQQVGEGAFETMVRLAGETAAFSDVAKTLGLNFTALKMGAVDAVQGLARAAGGYDALSSGLNNYASKFLDDAERLASVQEKVTESFASLGLEIPKTRDEFKSLIKNGVANPELFASLLGLVDATDYYLTALEKQNQITRDAAIAADELAQSRARELSDFMEPINDILAKSGMSDFEAALFDINSALDQSIAKARELGASEAQLADIRAASALEIQKLNRGQTDAALAGLRSAIDADKAQREQQLQAQMDAITAARDVSIAGVNSAQQSRIESANRWMQSQIDHFAKQIDRLSGSVSGLRSSSGSLRNLAESLLGVGEGNAIRNRAAALRELNEAISSARRGATPGKEAIDSIIGGVDVSENDFATMEQFIYEAARTASKVTELANLADSQATAEELMIEQLKLGQQSAQESNARLIDQYQRESQNQIAAITGASQAQMDLAKKINDEEIAKMEEQYSVFEAQIKALRGIDDSVLSVADAVTRLTEVMRVEAEAYPRAAAELQAGEMLKTNNEMLEQIKALREETYKFNAESRRTASDSLTALREIQIQGEEAA